MELGAASFTVMDTLVVSLPPLLLAVMVYVAVDVMEVGVPEISPVEVSKFRPLERLGEIHQVMTGPPEFDGEAERLEVPLVNSNWSVR